jgi:hypothetical protein
VRKSDGVHARFVSTTTPFAGARPVEPDLEDAFLLLMNPPPAAVAA